MIDGKKKKIFPKYKVTHKISGFFEIIKIVEKNNVYKFKISKMLSIFGISKNKCTKCYETYTDEQYKWCKSCQIKNLKKNFPNWSSGNEKIDKLIQKAQLNIDNPNQTIFEWISYDQFNIKDKGKDGLFTVYLTTWKDGPLYWDNKKYARDSDKNVVLKSIGSLGNSQNMNLNEVCVTSHFLILFYVCVTYNNLYL